MKSCKIDKIEGLSDRIQTLVSEGITSRAKVAEIVRDEFDIVISEPTIARRISLLKSNAKSHAFKIISDHVDKVIPQDLDALERMERLCLQWADEAEKDQTERVAEAVKKIAGELDEWRNVLLDSKDSNQAIHWIIKKCLFYIQRDATLQEQRIKAMRMAVQIIDTKLSKAGLLDDDNKGRIVFLTREKESGPSPAGDPGGSGRTPFVIRGGKKDE